MNNIYISGEKIMNLADVVILQKKYIKQFPSLTKYCKKLIFIDEKNNNFKINNCKIFFTKISYITYFIEKMLPLIKHKFILITHMGDQKAGLNKKILEHPFLIKWYGINMISTLKNVECIPLGLENLMWKRTKFSILDQYKNNIKSNLLYLNFNIKTNKNRPIILNTFLNKNFIKNNNKSWDDYIKELSTYKFCISPEGNGIDCHRTWECLYLNVIPIVKKSITMSYFDELPILFVDNYDIINEEYLDQYYLEFQNKKFNLDKLNYEYWKRIIK